MTKSVRYRMYRLDLLQDLYEVDQVASLRLKSSQAAIRSE
jgi:hypothetical protein